MAHASARKRLVAVSHSVRGPRVRDDRGVEIPVSVFPTAREMRELGRIADRVARGKEPLHRVKI